MERPERCQHLWYFLDEPGFLPEPVARGLFLQVLEAVQHCNSRGVLHCYIKAENVLVDLVTGEAKLIDLGCCRILQDTFYTRMSGAGCCGPGWKGGSTISLMGCTHTNTSVQPTRVDPLQLLPWPASHPPSVTWSAGTFLSTPMRTSSRASSSCPGCLKASLLDSHCGDMKKGSLGPPLIPPICKAESPCLGSAAGSLQSSPQLDFQESREMWPRSSCRSKEKGSEHAAEQAEDEKLVPRSKMIQQKRNEEKTDEVMGGNRLFQKPFQFWMIQQYLHHLLSIMPVERRKDERTERRKEGQKEGRKEGRKEKKEK